MIRRRTEAGWLMFSQLAHAWHAGALAAAWGGEALQSPALREAVILATRLHDIGWLAWDEVPRLGADGWPVNFIGLTLAETAPIWRQAVRQVTLLNPYSALLVSLHASTIYRRRLERGLDGPAEQDEAQTLAAEQAAIQDDLRERLAGFDVYRRAIEPAALHRSYRRLRVCDLLSLAVLADVLPPEGKIEEVPAIASGGDSEASEFFEIIHYARQGPYSLRLTPWPFVEPALSLPVECRFLEGETFASTAAYQQALAEAPWRTVMVHLLPAD